MCVCVCVSLCVSVCEQGVIEDGCFVRVFMGKNETEEGRTML